MNEGAIVAPSLQLFRATLAVRRPRLGRFRRRLADFMVVVDVLPLGLPFCAPSPDALCVAAV